MGTVKVWDIRTFECVQTIPVADCPDATSVTTCHRRIVVGGNRNIICFEYPQILYYTATVLDSITVNYPVDTEQREEKPSKPYLSEDAALVCCLYNNQSHTILTAAGTGVKLWDAKSGMLLRAHDHISPYQITSVCFESGQRKIFIGNVKGEIRVHHYGNGSLITRYQQTGMAGNNIVILQS
jgi:WD40 repeat protein